MKQECNATVNLVTISKYQIVGDRNNSRSTEIDLEWDTRCTYWVELLGARSLVRGPAEAGV